MTITIADGRGALWKWDTGRRLRVGSGVEQIHYQNKCFERTSFSDGSYPCRFDYNNNNGKNTPFWFTSCMLIDLTAAFGAGLEPSKDWMDKHVAAFADSQKVQYIENLDELFAGISSAIQTKSGQSGKIFACDFIDKILAL